MKAIARLHKQVLHTFDQGQMVWSWMFLEGGKEVAIVFGPTHGPEVGDYQLYDVKTGKLMSEVWGHADTQSLKTDAPDWAKRLQDRLRTLHWLSLGGEMIVRARSNWVSERWSR